MGLDSVTDEAFEQEVLHANGLVLVDFWAEWCAPCKQLLPALGEVAQNYEGELRVVKVNSDENRLSAERFNVRGLPTLILFKDGVELERVLGLQSKTRLSALIDKHLPA